MASAATPFTLMLSYTASSVLPQDHNPSLSFRPQKCFFNFSIPFSLYPVVLHCRERKSNNWVDFLTQVRAAPNCHHRRNFGQTRMISHKGDKKGLRDIYLSKH